MAPDKDEVAIRLYFWACCALVAAKFCFDWSAAAAMPRAVAVYYAFSPHPFFAYAMGGVFAVHALRHRGSRHVFIAMLIGAFLIAARSVVIGYPDARTHAVLGVAAYYLGVSSFLVLAWLCLRRRGTQEGRKLAATFRAACLAPLLVLAARLLLELSVVLRPDTLDAVLYRFDGSLGLQASGELGKLFARVPALEEAGQLFYAPLPLFAILAYALQEQNARANVLHAFVAIALLGTALYFLYPAAGPKYLFGPLFPDALPDAATVPPGPVHLPYGYRNAMPSLHLAWALAAWFAVRNTRAGWRLLFGLLVAMTLLSTLGLGEHYLIDLVVALPFTLACQALCVRQRNAGETRALAVGGALSAAWLVYLYIPAQHFTGAGAWHYGAIALTVAASALLMQGLRIRKTA